MAETTKHSRTTTARVPKASVPSANAATANVPMANVPMANVPMDSQELTAVAARGRLIRLPEVIERVGMKRSSIYRRMSEGDFPKSRSLGPRCAVWIEAEIDAWVSAIADRV